MKRSIQRLQKQAKATALESSSALRRASGAVADTGRRAGRKVIRAMRHNPLLVASAGAAAGFLLGTLLPATRRENEWMGRASDRVADDVKRAGRGAVDEGRELAQEAVAVANGAVREAAADTRELVREKLAQTVPT